MNNTTEFVAAAAASIAPETVESSWRELMGRVAGRFGRVEPRRTATRIVAGLLSQLPAKNCWTLAEQAGDPAPTTMQHLLSRARWDHDGMLTDVRDYAVESLGDREATLVVDETGDQKKGTHTVGVQRQYTGNDGPDREHPSRGVPVVSQHGRAHPYRHRALPAALVDR